MDGDRPILYSSVRSPHCFKVSLVLAEKGIEIDRVEIDLPAREQKTPAYLAINPLGQVPAYRDDRGVHIDSLVIMRHLDARHPDPRLFPPKGPDLDAVLGWIELSSTTMRDVSHELYWLLIEPPAGGADPAAVEHWRAAGTTVLDAVEAALTGGGGWLVGGALSAADLACFAWLHGYARFDLPSAWDRHPHVRDWLDRLRARPSFAAAHGAVGRPFEPDR